MSRIVLCALVAWAFGISFTSGEEVARPWIQLRQPTNPVGSTELRPWSPLRLSASVNYGDGLRTTIESRETMEFVLYATEAGKLRRIARLEVPLVASPAGGHYSWCETDAPVGGWPKAGIVAEARLRGMKQVRDRKTVTFQSGGEADAAIEQMVDADRSVEDRFDSEVVLVVGQDRAAEVPAGATFLVEGLAPTVDRDALPVEGMILATTGLIRTEELKAEGLWMHGNAYPALWPAGDGRSWFQMELVAPSEPGDYRVRVTLEADDVSKPIAEDMRLTVTAAEANR